MESLILFLSGACGHCDTHSDYDTPPPLPMFGPQPKKPKKEELSDTLANAAIAITKAFRSPVEPPSSSLPVSSQVGISPGKSVDLRMKTLQQLRYLQQLFDDKRLSESEFLEQKKSILESMRKL